MELRVHLRAFHGDPLSNQTRNHHLVVSLVNLAFAHPDISYRFHVQSQFASAPSQVHWNHLLRVLRYLCGTISHRLSFHAPVPYSFRHILRYLG